MYTTECGVHILEQSILDEVDTRNGLFSEDSIALLALPQRLFRPLALGDVLNCTIIVRYVALYIPDSVGID